MLNHHVESLAVRLLPQIIFDVFFFVDKLMLVKRVYGGVHFGRSLFHNPVDSRLGCDLVINQLQVFVEVVWARCGTSDSLGLFADSI